MTFKLFATNFTMMMMMMMMMILSFTLLTCKINANTLLDKTLLTMPFRFHLFKAQTKTLFTSTLLPLILKISYSRTTNVMVAK